MQKSHKSRRVNIALVMCPLAASALCGIPATYAQCEAEWTFSEDRPRARFRHGLVFDTSRGVAVMFGGYDVSVDLADTWEWNGTRWSPRLEPGPGDSGTPVVAYDSNRRVTVMVRRGPQEGMETWEWDGKRWRFRAVMELGCGFGEMTYDSRRGVSVALCIREGTIWEWDGARWESRGAGGLESGDFSLAYDSARGETVAFGSNGQTWEWNGTRWRFRTDEGPPAPRSGTAMAFDVRRAVTVLYQGGSAPESFSDTWEWDGQLWRQRADGTPSARKYAAMAYDSVRREVLLFGGRDGDPFSEDVFGDTWSWNGERWKLLDDGDPSVRWDHAMAYDSRRGSIVLFGGRNRFFGSQALGDTWEHDGRQWREIEVNGARPSVRAKHSMAYDSRRDVTVLYAGETPERFRIDDMWEWDGAAWTQVDMQGSPGQNGDIVYDEARDVLVFFGRAEGNPRIGATWEWDGIKWIHRGDGGPPGRQDHTLTYDSARGVTVLWGGLDRLDSGDWVVYGDIWEWDGVEWAQRADDTALRRYSHSAAYDASQRMTIIHGGFCCHRVCQTKSSFSWNGSEWKVIGPGTPPARNSGAMAYAVDRRTIVLHGGARGISGIHGGMGDTWERGPAIARGDANCDGSIDLADVEPFIKMLTKGKGCAECAVDVNSDGSVDLRDVEPFIELLLGG